MNSLPEPGTPAGRLHECTPIASEIAGRRKEEIMLAQQKIVFNKNAGLVGASLKVLIDETNPRKKTALARHPGQAPDIDDWSRHTSPADRFAGRTDHRPNQRL